LVLAARQLGLAQESTQESTAEEAAPEGRSDVPAPRQAASFDTGSFDILSSDTGTFRALTSARLAQASPYDAGASRAEPPRPAQPDGAAGRGPERRHPSNGPWSPGMKTILYAAVVALATSEITWALNYWPVNGLFGGAFLLSGFYFMVGILSHHLQQRLSGRLVAEYGTVALAGSLLIAIAGLMRRAA
ncbi:MAG TPA: hypothetical protein VHN78_05825, partial [Chloroflexota bacterium]|nr:hypothetical protein [Chloroflexota bacterium]